MLSEVGRLISETRTSGHALLKNLKSKKKKKIKLPTTWKQVDIHSI